MSLKGSFVALALLTATLSIGCELPEETAAEAEAEGATGMELEYSSAGLTCRVIAYTRMNSQTDEPANIYSQGAHPADQELWRRIRDCANANRCNWNYDSLYTSNGCIQKFCKKQWDMCQFGEYHNVPGVPQTPPPVNKTWNCQAKGYANLTVNGRYEYYSITGKGQNQDRDTASNAAVQQCRTFMRTNLQRYAPSQEVQVCKHFYCN